MAKPIKATPTLTGRDARRFVDNIDKNRSVRQSLQEYERQKAIYDKYKNVFSF